MWDLGNRGVVNTENRKHSTGTGRGYSAGQSMKEMSDDWVNTDEDIRVQ